MLNLVKRREVQTCRQRYTGHFQLFSVCEDSI